MPDEEDLDAIEQSIIQNVQGPAKASDDTGSMEQHKLSEQLDALDRLRSRQNTSRGRGLGIRHVKNVLPGPC